MAAQFLISWRAAYLSVVVKEQDDRCLIASESRLMCENKRAAEADTERVRAKVCGCGGVLQPMRALHVEACSCNESS